MNQQKFDDNSALYFDFTEFFEPEQEDEDYEEEEEEEEGDDMVSEEIPS